MVPVGCSRYLPLWRAAPSGAPLATKDSFFQLTVLVQRLVERPRADVDRDEDEEDQAQEEAGPRGGPREELLTQRSLPQPGLAGCCEPLRCHGNRGGSPAEPDVYYLRIRARTPPPPPGPGGLASSPPASALRGKLKSDAARRTRCKRFVSVAWWPGRTPRVEAHAISARAAPPSPPFRRVPQGRGATRASESPSRSADALGPGPGEEPQRGAPQMETEARRGRFSRTVPKPGRVYSSWPSPRRLSKGREGA